MNKQKKRAIYAGSCIKRYSPEGKLERTVKLECEKPTSFITFY